MAAAAAALSSASAEPIATADADVPGLAYWQRLEGLYRRAKARSERASDLCEVADAAAGNTPEGSR
ncbi:MAG: hypothetical protein K2X34_06105 [Hyphomonadaceae bacterium]|nr:hypothetical protein [Hyphomonadaceae bacterium]